MSFGLPCVRAGCATAARGSARLPAGRIFASIWQCQASLTLFMALLLTSPSALVSLRLIRAKFSEPTEPTPREPMPMVLLALVVFGAHGSQPASAHPEFAGPWTAWPVGQYEGPAGPAQWHPDPQT